MAKQDEYVRYTIRVPTELYEKLKQAAGEKSVNAEIVLRLDQSFDLDAAVGGGAPEELLQALLAKMEEERQERLQMNEAILGISESLAAERGSPFRVGRNWMAERLSILSEYLPPEERDEALAAVEKLLNAAPDEKALPSK